MVLETRANIKMINGVWIDIIRFVKAAFDSGLTPLSFGNIIIGDELKYVIKDMKPDVKSSSGTDLMIVGVLPSANYDTPYIQVGSFNPTPLSNLNINQLSEIGTYIDDNGEEKKGILCGGAISGNMTLNIGAFTQEMRNEILEWLLIYFSIAHKILDKGSDELGLSGDVQVGKFTISVNDSPQKVINDRMLWKGQFKLEASGYWEVFIPLEGVFNGVNVNDSYFLQKVKENLIDI